MVETKLTPGLYLEIGVGSNDFSPNPTMIQDVNGLRPARRFVDGAQYVGIDLPRIPDRYWFAMQAFVTGDEGAAQAAEIAGTVAAVVTDMAAAQRTAARAMAGESIQFMVADAHQLPFADASAEEVYMCDVLSSQLADDSVKRIIQESRRVLKPGRMLVSRECFTPQWSDVDYQTRYLVESGFKTVTVVPFDQPRYKELAAEYGATAYECPENVFPDDMFFRLAQ